MLFISSQWTLKADHRETAGRRLLHRMAEGRRLLLLLAVAWAVHRCDAFVPSAGAPCIRGLSRDVGVLLRERRAPRAAQRRPTASLAALDEMEGVALTHHFVSVSDKISLHVVEAGRSDAPTVCLLHGFPDFWLSWRRQLPRLVQVSVPCASSMPDACFQHPCGPASSLSLFVSAGIEHAHCLFRPDTGSSVQTCGATLRPQSPQGSKTTQRWP